MSGPRVHRRGEEHPAYGEDQAAREVARTLFDRPLVLEAGAGTGKTATLVARVLTWSLTEGWLRAEASLDGEPQLGPEATEDPEELRERVAVRVLERVAAITFTERAALEMAERLTSALGSLVLGEPVIALPAERLGLTDSELRERARALSRSTERLRMGTIHSFCRGLLSEFPVEAGLHPGFEVDADGRARRGVIEDTLARELPRVFGEEGDADYESLAARGIGPGELVSALDTLMGEGLRGGDLDQDPLAPKRIAEVFRKLVVSAQAMGTLLGPIVRGGKPGRIQKVYRIAEICALVEARDPAPKSVDELLDLAEAEDFGGVSSKLQDWCKGKFSKSEVARIEEAHGAESDALDRILRAATALAPRLAHLFRLDAEQFGASRRVLAQLHGRVLERLRERGIEGFSDLLADARDLLKHSPRVRAQVQRSMDLLLVDEFQDTDPLQYEIVGALALPEAPDKGSSTSDPLPSLFLVGDPKQSIYAWRGADLGAYADFLQRVLDVGGERQELCVNYRSAPAVLREVERILSPLMVEERGIQPKFQPLLPSPRSLEAEPFAAPDRSELEHWISWSLDADPKGARHGSTGATRARTIEAEALARDLLALHGSGALQWSDAAILLRVTSQQDLYLAALRAVGIPYVVERDRSYYRRREVQDAAALVRCTLDPNDLLALVAALRAPFVGVPDAAWLPLWRAGFPELSVGLGGEESALDSVRESIRSVVQSLDRQGDALLAKIPGWGLSLEHACEVIHRARKSFQGESADRALDVLRRGLLVEGTEAGRFLGAHRLANLERFFRRILELLLESGGGPQAVLRELRAGMAGLREEESGAPGDEGLDAVRVMTIHKAKGLEFDHVYLVDLHHESRGGHESERSSVDRLPDGRVESVLFGVPSPGRLDVDEHRDRVAEAEEIRTLYVATTRAGRRLVTAGRWPKEGSQTGSQAGPGNRIKSHADALARRKGGGAPLNLLLGNLEEGTGGTPNLLREEGEDGVRWRLPDGDVVGADSDRRRTPERREETAGPTLAEAGGDAQRIAERRGAALRRMDLGRSGTVSGAGHAAAPRPSHPEGEFDDVQPLGRDLARAQGTFLHEVIETFDFAEDPKVEWSRQARRLERHVGQHLTAELEEPGRVAFTKALRAWAESRLFERLEGIADSIVGREVPLLLRPGPGDSALDVVVGTVDLIYRDPEDGAWVVVEFKSDALEPGADLEPRIAVHRDQVTRYGRALQDHLGTNSRVRLELWFLSADRACSVPFAAVEG